MQTSKTFTTGKQVRTVCTYCAVGCGMLAQVRGSRIVSLAGDPSHPANRGRLCSKGRTLHETVENNERAGHPLLRIDTSEILAPVSWDTALGESAGRFADIIREHGPDAVAFYVSGQLLTEDYYVLNKLMKGFIGSNNIDSNSRLCMSSAVAGYKRAFGVDGPPGCYEDIDEAGRIFLFGANPAFAHPILYRRMEDARRRNPALRVVVVDPRRTDSCSLADLHLPIRPGTDTALLLAMFNVLLWEGMVDQGWVEAHTQGFRETAAIARQMTPRKAAEICGVPAADIVQAAHWFGEGPSLSLWTMGFNQSTSGTDKNNALINLHLATGQVGQPGSGPFSLTGQPNAMGGREAGGLANLLPGHRDMASQTDRDELATFWGGGVISPTPGLPAVELFRGLEDGRVKAVWIICTNPLVSMPDSDQARRALAKAEWVMVSEAFHPTDTSRAAHVVLPAAAWGEKEGTVTNSERRISRVRKAVLPPGEARPDWEMAAHFARLLGEQLGQDWSSAFAWPSAAEVFREHAASTVGRDCDIGGLDYQVLDELGPQQWPFPQGATQGTARLYGDGTFPTEGGRANFLPITYQPVARPTSAAFPLSLTTGRVRDQWHTMTRTGRVGALNLQAPVPRLQMHPTDAATRRLGGDDLVEVRSALGGVTVPIEISEDIRPGVVFLPMHWGRMSAPAGDVNRVIFGDVDQVSNQPEFKHSPVEVHPVTLPRRGILALRGDHVAALRSLVEAFPYGVYAYLGADTTYTVAELAVGPGDERLSGSALDAQLDPLLPGGQVMACDDDMQGSSKRIWFADGGFAGMRWLGTSPGALEWLRGALLSNAPVDVWRTWLFDPDGRWPQAQDGALVCSCHGVAEGAIRDVIQNGARTVEAIQETCPAGTGCGSCLPQIERMLRAASEPAGLRLVGPPARLPRVGEGS